MFCSVVFKEEAERKLTNLLSKDESSDASESTDAVDEADAAASRFYAKFRALAPRVRPLTTELERRAARRECAALLRDVSFIFV